MPVSYCPAEQSLQSGGFDDGLQLKELRDDTNSTESHMCVLELHQLTNHYQVGFNAEIHNVLLILIVSPL